MLPPKEEHSLKCEECGLLYDDELNYENIDQTGKCHDCDNNNYEEEL